MVWVLLLVAIHAQSCLFTARVTKSFMIQLSLSLRNAYPKSETGLEFHVLHPHFVRTNMTEGGPMKAGDLIKIGKNILFPDVDSWVKSALKVRLENKPL